MHSRFQDLVPVHLKEEGDPELERPSEEDIEEVLYSAVARGGARGARAPPVFYLKSKNRPHKMLKIKYYQTTVWEVFKKRPANEIYVCL